MDLLTKAICFAAEKHAGQKRKGSDTPYIVHPMEAVAVAASVTDDVEILAAAALHDVAEDCGVTRQTLETLFGQRVAALVAADSEDKREDRPAAETWLERKQETVNALKNMDRAEKTVVLADKVSNMRAICRDHLRLGDGLWQRFNCKDKARHAWYYRAVLAALEPELGDTLAWQELAALINKTFG